MNISHKIVFKADDGITKTFKTSDGYYHQLPRIGDNIVFKDYKWTYTVVSVMFVESLFQCGLFDCTIRLKKENQDDSNS